MSGLTMDPQVNLYACPQCEMQFKSHNLMRRHLDHLCVGGETIYVLREPPKATTSESRQELQGQVMIDEIPERDIKPETSKRRPVSRTSAQKKTSGKLPVEGHVESPGFDPEDEERRLFAEIQRLNAQLQEPVDPGAQDASGGYVPFDTVKASVPRVASSLSNYTLGETGRRSPRPPSRNKPKKREEGEDIDPDEKLIMEINKRTEELDRRKLEIEKELMKLQLQSSQKKRVSSSNAEKPKEHHSGTSKDSDYDVILRAIRQQDEQLTRAADSIRDELRQLKKERSQAGNGNVPTTNPPMTFLPYQANNPASEFNALKTSYLLSGGQDPNVLRQMNEAVGDALDKQSHPPKALLGINPRGHQTEITSRFGADFMSPAQSLKLLGYERENRLLHQELELLRYRKNTGESDLQKIEREHYSKMLSLQHEIETLKAEAYVKQLKNQMNPTDPSAAQPNREIPHLMTVPTSLAMTSYDDLHSQPYDPTAGFVIFYDFILPVDPAYKKVQLITSIYNGPHQICSPTVLPERDCFALIPFATFVQPMGGQLGFTLLSTSQPVQRCRPGPDLALVIEVQALNQLTNQQSTIGWTKVLLFDNQMRVLAGRWRSPIRFAPLRTDLLPKDLNTIPQCGLMEIFYRIANYRDADIQASVKVNHLAAGEYKYAPQSFGHPVYYHPPAPPEPKPTRPETPPSEIQVQLPEFDPRSKSGPPPPPSAGGGSNRAPRRQPTNPSATGPSEGSQSPSKERRRSQDSQKEGGSQGKKTGVPGKEDSKKSASETNK